MTAARPATRGRLATANASRGADVLVVGAGIVGTALAYHLALAGAAVTLIDAGEPAAGTTSASLAWLNSFHKAPRAYHDLNVAGLAEHKRLGAELGAAPWLHLDGGLQWATTSVESAALRRDAERLASWGYPIEALTPGTVMRDLEPGLRLDLARVTEVWHTPQEGWIDAPLLARELARRARVRGAHLITNDGVVAIAVARGRVHGLALASGRALSASRIVVCAGAASDQIAGLAGAALPLDRAPGLLTLTSSVATTVRHVCHARDVAIRPDPSGGLLLGHAATLDATIGAATPTVPPPPGCAELLARAARYFPTLSTARVVAARIGVRPIPRDGVTIAGPCPEVEGLYVAVTHSGITLGALLGRLLAGELTSGAVSTLLEPFRPARFATGTHL